MLYLLSCVGDSIDDKIDNPPISFDIFCHKVDNYIDICCSDKKD